MIDIVFPQKNESEFIEIAARLGFKALLLVYSDKKDFPKIKSDEIELFFGTLWPKKSGFVVAKSSDEDRAILEKGKADLLFDQELRAEKDTMHQRLSGLNHIMCKLNKSTIIGLDFGAVLNSSGRKRALIMGRLAQNVRLCRKYANAMAIGSFASEPWSMRAPPELASAGICLGMTNIEAKKAVEIMYERLKEK